SRTSALRQSPQGSCQKNRGRVYFISAPSGFARSRLRNSTRSRPHARNAHRFGGFVVAPGRPLLCFLRTLRERARSRQGLANGTPSSLGWCVAHLLLLRRRPSPLLLRVKARGRAAIRGVEAGAPDESERARRPLLARQSGEAHLAPRSALPS